MSDHDSLSIDASSVLTCSYLGEAEQELHKYFEKVGLEMGLGEISIYDLPAIFAAQESLFYNGYPSKICHIGFGWPPKLN